ncbi:MAG: LysM peptidoglycan-binding domain-containing protein [Croceibacterium sp.]
MTNHIYLIRPGDTLGGIAHRFRVSLARLGSLNRIVNPDRIRAGQMLKVPDDVPPPVPLGELSRRYEVDSRGPGAVSSGRGDRGGVSYGSYQLSAAQGRTAQFLAAEGRPWAARFTGSAAGSAQFSAAWQRCAEGSPETFDAAQHAFIERTHYAVQAALLKRTAGLDLAVHSRALQEVVWSTAVQHGPNCGIILAALRTVPEACSDAVLIRAIYAERARRSGDGTLAHFGGNSPAVQEGVARRLDSECRDALALLCGEDG